MSDPSSDQVLRFWFDVHPKDWFVKNPDFDAQVRSRFLALHEAAAAGRLAHWADEPRSCLALVIVLDQFPRNMFRGEARAFATDPLALAAARVILRRGWDKQMSTSERLFAYLPFEHSEALEDQKLSSELMKDFDEEQRRYAERHRDIVERFGRFPHRNAILGRESTAAEIEFLKLPGSGF
ncbi:MAG: DUF924 domain-containing protein [Betaproteobacteria bacterium]|nr:DUF924 domain-containing protein [Betaproteobacteria bacterium]